MWKYGGLGKHLAYGAALALPFLGDGCATAERAEKTYPISQRGIDVLCATPTHCYIFSGKMRLETLKVLRTNPEQAEDHIISCLKDDLLMIEKVQKIYAPVSEPTKKELDEKVYEYKKEILKALTRE